LKCVIARTMVEYPAAASIWPSTFLYGKSDTAFKLPTRPRM